MLPLRLFLFGFELVILFLLLPLRLAFALVGLVVAGFGGVFFMFGALLALAVAGLAPLLFLFLLAVVLVKLVRVRSA